MDSIWILLIIDDIGNVREWMRGTAKQVSEACNQLPDNGWRQYDIKLEK